jgi:hypothetical protein
VRSIRGKNRRGKNRVMIIENQSNIKVHFAGLESQDFAEVLHKCSGIKYSLFTVFPFIAQSLGIKAIKFKSCTEETHKYLQTASRHTIMDSGLFTLMFGAHAGKRTKKEIEIWYNALVNFVHQNKVGATCVEVDCQKILGVEAAWDYRERIAKDLPSNRIINVFHKDDGQKGLDRMIEFSNYIAVSVPELRSLGQKKSVIDIAHYIKNKKPNIDIHLLGCTESKLLKELNFCSSSDSTSWQQVGRYGKLNYNDGKKTYSALNKNISIAALEERYLAELQKIIPKYIDLTPNRISYYSKFALSAELMKNQYTIYGGSQD